MDGFIFGEIIGCVVRFLWRVANKIMVEATNL